MQFNYFVHGVLRSRLCMYKSILHPIFYFKSAKDCCNCHPSEVWCDRRPKFGNDMCSCTKVRNTCSYTNVLSTALHYTCQNDVINGWFRVECKILIFLTLHPIEITRFIQSVQSNSITSAALELAVGTQSVSGFVSFSH